MNDTSRIENSNSVWGKIATDSMQQDTWIMPALCILKFYLTNPAHAVNAKWRWIKKAENQRTTTK